MLPAAGVASPPPATGTYQPAGRVDGPMVRRLLDSPTRGNLAGDRALIADIERQYRAARARLLVDPTLDRVKVLLAHDVPGARTVVVAFLNDSHALLRHGDGPAGAAVPELLRMTGTPDEPHPLEPYLFYGRHWPTDVGFRPDLLVGLAPAGCVVETSADGRIQRDGRVVRSWQAAGTDGFVVRGAGQTAERWRFTCDGVVRYSAPAGGGGVVRYSGPAGGGPAAAGPTASAVSTAGARGPVDATLAADAVRDLRGELDRHGLTGSVPRVVWGGRLPDWVPGAPEAVMVSSCSADEGCALLLKTRAGTLPRSEPGSPTDSSAVAGSPDLLVVPVPGEAAGVLVVGPEPAARVELFDGKGRTIASGRLDNGAGAVRVDPRRVAQAKVFDKGGRPLRTGATPGLDGGLGEPTVWAR
ncbi:hypothetical protein GA0070606_4556 [Micromonospora citrea]|uniref:Uncharacterized protein n=1 Tax=Micromonospora citrea TaxID=47855 RepID=A0A1C6VMB3_9ACTN|nr:hypothetical protein [Micromonospora citrea]SCL67453.1 hypothetical protein GA0070606_4556 [Micromonospora citrea]